MKTVYQIRLYDYNDPQQTTNTAWGTLKDTKEQLRRIANSYSYTVGGVIPFDLVKADYEKNVFMGNPVLVKRGYVQIQAKIFYEK